MDRFCGPRKAGSLLRVFRANDVVDGVLETDIALQNLQWAWDVSTRGMPRSPTGDGRLMIIGPDYSFVLSSTNTLTFQQVQEQIAVLVERGTGGWCCCCGLC